jgi:hypothetical protein
MGTFGLELAGLQLTTSPANRTNGLPRTSWQDTAPRQGSKRKLVRRLLVREKETKPAGPEAAVTGTEVEACHYRSSGLLSYKPIARRTKQLDASPKCRFIVIAEEVGHSRSRPMQRTVGALPETLLSHQALDSNGRKARYGMAYLEAVSFQAGVPVTPTAQDSDVLGVDCTLEFPQCPIRIQVKCTSRPLAPTTGTMSYDIGETVFAKWRRNAYPVYLVVVVVPQDHDTWHDFGIDDQTLARSAAYWAEVDRNKTTGPWSVGLRRENRLTPAALRQWHAQSFGGGFGG